MEQDDYLHLLDCVADIGYTKTAQTIQEAYDTRHVSEWDASNALYKLGRLYHAEYGTLPNNGAGYTLH